ncbi:pseudouridine synthase [Entomoplasma freundtii]|uniref:Ribosomal large subunit pseudouridine synthase B n=1 Tax=Entomoplasma freundtii TaxID=74700 RepID=A0A2K8NTN3_9MOLU|nr:pseudouridine synthase [Entomoplasma freundtii]ATZ16538.1 ribosomal large subunit pseudouridine synthase B [Entomoplasma freundtii]TDY58296.1 pseudouridine synthase [Entomoplasma freundtii]
MPQERLQKIIANRGAVSRRRAETLIELGRVKVDGKVITEKGFKTNLDAFIEIDNREVVKQNDKYYYLFNKPRFVLTTMYDPKGRKTVADFFKDVPARVYPVGRLDYDVSGLLIMTNDGDFANFVMHPRYEFLKTYQALCQGNVSPMAVKQLIKGVTIDEDYRTQAVSAKLLSYNPETNQSVVELTIAEGKKHHVKKMLEAAGMNLLKLKRTKVEFLTLDNLDLGHYRDLTPHEVKQFYGIYKANRRKDD